MKKLMLIIGITISLFTMSAYAGQTRAEWFGGEPFLYFDKVIRPISEYAISICNEAKIPFFNSATTNGFYLTSKILPQLDKLKFRRFQITIDGNREFHDKVKFQKGCSSTFNHVLTNINNILTQNKDVDTGVF